jgi:hypothetical protein
VLEFRGALSFVRTTECHWVRFLASLRFFPALCLGSGGIQPREDN